MKKKSLIFLVAIIFALGISQNTSASTTEELPTADNPFWNVMTQINTPDDPTCPTKAKDALDASSIPGDTTSMATQMCGGIALIKTSMQTSMQNEGVGTNLFEQADWHHVDDLYFEKVGYGRISFSNEIDFMSRNFMLFMSTFGERMGMSQGEIGLDADIVAGLRDSGATLIMYNVGNYSELEILVNGQQDNSGVVSNLIYDQANRTITFDAAHFTTFTAHDKNQAEKPKLTKVFSERSIIKGEQIITLTITGKHFKNKTEVRLGSVKAFSIKKIDSKHLVAKFKVKKLEKVGKDVVKLKASNPDSGNKTFKKKIIISEIK